MYSYNCGFENNSASFFFPSYTRTLKLRLYPFTNTHSILLTFIHSRSENLQMLPNDIFLTRMQGFKTTLLFLGIDPSLQPQAWPSMHKKYLNPKSRLLSNCMHASLKPCFVGHFFRSKITHRLCTTVSRMLNYVENTVSMFLLQRLFFCTFPTLPGVSYLQLCFEK